MKEKEVLSTIWYFVQAKSFFLLPSSMRPESGNEILEDMSGNKIAINIDSLQLYSCTSDQARQYLENNWNMAMEKAKTAWNQMYHLTELSGKGYDLEKMKDNMIDAFSDQGKMVTDSLGQGRKAVEELLKAVQSGNPSTSVEEQTVLKNIFKQMPALEQFFSKEELDKATEDPDAWARQLQKKFIEPLEKDRKTKTGQGLAEDIQASISAGLRRAGIVPAEDFKKQENTSPKE